MSAGRLFTKRWRFRMQTMKQQPAWVKKLPFYYGWVIVGSGILSLMATSGATLWGFAFFSVPMGEELGWSNQTAVATELPMQMGGDACCSTDGGDGCACC